MGLAEIEEDLYYTGEAPPLWILPAWPIANLAINRIVRFLRITLPKHPRQLWIISDDAVNDQIHHRRHTEHIVYRPSEDFLSSAMGAPHESTFDQPGIDGGLVRRTDPEIGVENTIDVSSLDKSLSKVEANGGQVIRPKMAVPGVGWMAYIKDTEGNIFGLMESDTSVV